MSLEQTWRCCDPSDLVTLEDIRQKGNTAINSAFNGITNGEVWEEKVVEERKYFFE